MTSYIKSSYYLWFLIIHLVRSFYVIYIFCRRGCNHTHCFVISSCIFRRYNNFRIHLWVTRQTVPLRQILCSTTSLKWITVAINIWIEHKKLAQPPTFGRKLDFKMINLSRLSCFYDVQNKLYFGIMSKIQWHIFYYKLNTYLMWTSKTINRQFHTLK